MLDIERIINKIKIIIKRKYVENNNRKEGGDDTRKKEIFKT